MLAATRVGCIAALAAFVVWAPDCHSRQETTPTSFSVRVLAEGSVRVPLGNARVAYRHENGASVNGQVRAGPDGVAVVSDLAEGLYALEVATPGYVTRTDASVVLVEDATTYVTVVLQSEPASAKNIRFGALLFGGVVLVATIARGRSRAERMRSE